MATDAPKPQDVRRAAKFVTETLGCQAFCDGTNVSANKFPRFWNSNQVSVKLVKIGRGVLAGEVSGQNRVNRRLVADLLRRIESPRGSTG
jgi:hypothetical protein